MKIKKFLFHIAVTLVILFGGLLVIGYLQTGQIDGLQLVGLAGGMLLLGVVVILRGMAQTKPGELGADKSSQIRAAAPAKPSAGSASASSRSGRSKTKRQLRRK